MNYFYRSDFGDQLGCQPSSPSQALLFSQESARPFQARASSVSMLLDDRDSQSNPSISDGGYRVVPGAEFDGCGVGLPSITERTATVVGILKFRSAARASALLVSKLPVRSLAEES